MDMWQGLASRSRAMSRRSDEDAARFRERVSVGRLAPRTFVASAARDQLTRGCVGYS